MRLDLLLIASIAPLVSPSYIRTPFTIKTGDYSLSLVARDEDSSLQLPATYHNESFVYISFHLGTPPQPFYGRLALKETRVVVHDVSDLYCDDASFGGTPLVDMLDTSLAKQCSGLFNTKDSSTYNASNDTEEYRVEYDSGSYAAGYLGYDVLSFPGSNVTIEDVEIIAANTSNTKELTFGIGPDWSLLDENSGELKNFTSPVTKMKEAGLIKKSAFSVFVNSSESGEVLFGAVDHSKYQGELTTVPFATIKNRFPDENTDGSVYFDSVMITTSELGFQGLHKEYTAKTYDNLPAELILENSFSSLPYDFVQEVFPDLGAEFVPEEYAWVLSKCPTNEEAYSQYFVFNFQGKLIKAPLRDFITYQNGTCHINIRDDDTEKIILGLGFLKSAYIVIDYEDYTVSLAQSRLVPDDDREGEDIEVIESSIPSAASAPFYSVTATSADWNSKISGDNVFTVSEDSGINYNGLTTTGDDWSSQIKFASEATFTFDSSGAASKTAVSSIASSSKTASTSGDSMSSSPASASSSSSSTTSSSSSGIAGNVAAQNTILLLAPFLLALL